MKLKYITTALAAMTMTMTADVHSRSILVGNAYVMDNNPEGNRMVVYGRFSNGELRQFGSVRTGGLGAGDNAPVDALGGQESIILSDDGRFMYSVNAGSDNISVFFLTKKGRPVLIQKISSQGDFPVSMTLDDDVLYILNAGSNGSIAGFDVSKEGRLSLIEDSVRSLNTGIDGVPEGDLRNLAPGDIAFDSANRRLLIPFGRGLELGEGRLLSFAIDDDNKPSADFTEVIAPGRLPFSVDFTRNGIALVADALGPEAGAPGSGIGGGLSSLVYTEGTNLSAVDSVANGQIETCWVRAAHNSDLVFTTNTSADSISSYTVSRNGVISIIDATAAADVGTPVDFDLTKDDRFLYVTTSTDGGVRGYRVDQKTGALREIGLFSGLPTSETDNFAPQGLAVR